VTNVMAKYSSSVFATTLVPAPIIVLVLVWCRHLRINPHDNQISQLFDRQQQHHMPLFYLFLLYKDAKSSKEHIYRGIFFLVVWLGQQSHSKFVWEGGR